MRQPLFRRYQPGVPDHRGPAARPPGRRWAGEIPAALALTAALLDWGFTHTPSGATGIGRLTGA